MEYFGIPASKSKDLNAFILALKEFLLGCQKIIAQNSKQRLVTNNPISNLANAIKMGQLNNRAMLKKTPQ